MKSRMCKKLKQNKAFTLMEMMVVLTLVVTLLAISVVGISDWSKKLKMAELDNYAKSVYLEAQNQLAAMKAEGSLPTLYNEFVDDEDGIYYAEYKGRNLTVQPADYNLELFGDFYKGIYYFTDADAVTKLFIPEISMSDEYGNYLVEVNLKTGDVYGVLYWEDTNEYLTVANIPEDKTYSEVVYGKINAMEVKGGSNNRSLESRSEYEIGYYGGTGGDSIATSGYRLNQEVKIVNDEELYLEISYDLNDVTIGQVGEVINQFDIEITIKGETSGAEWIHKHVLNDNNYREAAPRFITVFLLDGMGEKQSFADIVASINTANGDTLTGSFIPGENLEISVKTIYQHGGIILKEQSNAYRTNSLFHDVTDLYVEGGAEQIVERTIGVSAVRHLKNLGEAKYNGEIVTTTNGKPVGSYVIVQKDDIDLDKAVYAFKTDERNNIIFTSPENAPISFIEPITNDAIFWNGTKVKVDGNNYVIRNLVVQESANDTTDVGLFRKANNAHFVNVKLEDYTLTAPESSTNVGGLVGFAKESKIEQSGVYLMPYFRDETGAKQYYSQLRGERGNMMMDHYTSMMVTGGTVVGGLAGKVVGTEITDSFTAVQVSGVNKVGGLVGEAYGKAPSGNTVEGFTPTTNISQYVTIKNCYASGDVTAKSNTAAGLIGYAEKLCVYNAYTTSDVKCSTTVGGFVAHAVSSYFRECKSYGEVLNFEGNDNFAQNTAGGFFAKQTSSNADLTNVAYLSQVGYNSNDEAFVDDDLFKKEYKDLTDATATGTAANSHPYDGNLMFKAFPYKMVTNNHYGDWPIQYFINTSLVYYEKYADDTYGYYSVTKLTDASQTGTDANKYVWVLDSLRDDVECREDGYAILTMFYLDSVDYTVYQYKGNVPTWQQAVDQKGTAIKGTLEMVESQSAAGSGKMVNLTQQGSLVFNAYEEAADRPYSVNYRDKEIRSSFVTNGMYLYQLPYELQNTYRYDVKDFYDVIVFDDGYAKGNTPTEGYNPTPVIDGEQYYYCPHFPKLAVNPGMDKVSADQAGTGLYKHLGQPTEVAVRTARHLNNLGRVPYYWNNRGGAADVITYNQELEINFGTYARWNDDSLDQMYCGKVYNLLAFNQEYSNQPIGQNAKETTGYGAFQNDYNGNYNKIIDYCVKSSNQYVGLFGEIYKAEGAKGAQISNVVMTVSSDNKGNKGNYLSADEKAQNNAGLIIGTYQDNSGKSGNNRNRTGVGSLVGSDYTVGKAFESSDFTANRDKLIYTIYNCVSADYQVQYHVGATQSGYQQPIGIAVGGMIGYSRGNVAHSSAVNNITVVVRENLSEKNSAIAVGGFAGSGYYGTILNCYAGGVIDVDDNNHVNYVDRMHISGFCPGWLTAPGVSADSSSTANVVYVNIYSYAKITDRTRFVPKSSGGDFNYFIPTVGRGRLVYSSNKWGVTVDSGSTGISVPGYSYYLSTPEMLQVMNENSPDCKDYYEYSKNSLPKTSDVATYYQLSNKEWVNKNWSFYNHGKSDYTSVYLKETSDYEHVETLENGYPFPVYVKDAENKYVHYGDWPENTIVEGTKVSDNGLNVSFEYTYWSWSGILYLPKTTTTTGTFGWYQLDGNTYYTDFYYTMGHTDVSSASLKIACQLPGFASNEYLNFTMKPKVNGSGVCEKNRDGYQTFYYDEGDQSSTLRPEVTYRLYIYKNGNEYTWKLIEL